MRERNHCAMCCHTLDLGAERIAASRNLQHAFTTGTLALEKVPIGVARKDLRTREALVLSVVVLHQRGRRFGIELWQRQLCGARRAFKRAGEHHRFDAVEQPREQRPELDRLLLASLGQRQVCSSGVASGN